MGRGIAQVAAQAGYSVRLADAVPEVARAAREAVRGALDREVGKGRLDPAARDATLARLWVAPGLEEAVAGADLVIEAVPERLELKQEIFRRLDRTAPETALLATNTSSLSVTRIASVVGDPARVFGFHFFNPPHRMRLVEIVLGERTSPRCVERAREAATRMGKEAILVRDSPGFATSRLGVALGLEAIRMVEEKVADPADIDRAMELGYGHPMGPLRVTDLVGLDVRLAIAETLFRELGGDAFRPPGLLRRMVREGKLGKKTGEGFYRWSREG
jgi:3-hydroxybutyryl-CoA dehydrogenase